MDNEHPLNPFDGPDNRKEKAPKKKEPSDTIPYLILMGIWALWFAMFSGDDSSSSSSHTRARFPEPQLEVVGLSHLHCR